MLFAAEAFFTTTRCAYLYRVKKKKKEDILFRFWINISRQQPCPLSSLSSFIFSASAWLKCCFTCTVCWDDAGANAEHNKPSRAFYFYSSPPPHLTSGMGVLGHEIVELGRAPLQAWLQEIVITVRRIISNRCCLYVAPHHEEPSHGRHRRGGSVILNVLDEGRPQKGF